MNPPLVVSNRTGFATAPRRVAGRLALAVVTLAAAGLAFPAAAGAGLGELVQKAGTAGCISDSGALGECIDVVALDDPQSVAVSPDGTSAYVASFDGHSVAVFDRSADGTLTQKAGTAGCISDTGSGGACADGVALSFPRFVAVSPDGTSVYVVSSGSDAVAVFDRAFNGFLSQKAGSAGCVSQDGKFGCGSGRVLDSPNSLAVSPDGTSVYVTSSLDVVEVFDRAANGALTQRAGTEACIQEEGLFGCADGKALDRTSSVAVSPDGASVYVTGMFDSLIPDDGAVAVFDRAANGALTQKAGTAGCISYSAATTGAPCAVRRRRIEYAAPSASWAPAI